MAGLISVVAAVGTGLDLVRRKPRAVMAWGLVLWPAFGILLGAYGMFFATFLSLAASEKTGAEPSAEPDPAILGVMLAGQGGIFLAAIVLIFLQTIVTSAIWRAVLHPEQDRWAYLRVGKALPSP